MSHNLTPLYLSSLVPQSVSNISRYSLRNSNDLQTIDARTTLYYNSFLPSTVRAWNNVHDEAKQSDSLNTFKYCLNKNKTRIPKHFYVGSRKAQVLHTRLRTNCSSLNLDLFLRNISDSPLCQCGSIENAQHYFFTAGTIRSNVLSSYIQCHSIKLPRCPFFYMAMILFLLAQIKLYLKRCINSSWIRNVSEHIILSKSKRLVCMYIFVSNVNRCV